MTMLPPSLHPKLRHQLHTVKAQHEEDIQDNDGEVHLPQVLRCKSPDAAHRVAVALSLRLEDGYDAVQRPFGHKSRASTEVAGGVN